jgi:abortive infection bacteriophage resistance protein
MPRIFKKPALTIDQQVNLLNQRGLVIPDENRLRHYLHFIGYYRLSGYCRYFQIKNDPQHIFKPGTTFDEVLDLYIFDRELRLLVMDAIERVEVAVRSCITNEMGVAHGTHWYMNPNHFYDAKRHKDMLDKIRNETSNHHRQEGFLKTYYANYDQPALPPTWMVSEVMSLGVWSNLFNNLKNYNKGVISNHFGLPPKVMNSWLHSLTYTRNLCAHHSRVWNREYSIQPVIAKGFDRQLRNDGKDNNHRLYAQAVVIYKFMYVIADGSRWQYRLSDLLDENPNAPLAEMGFPVGWKDDPFWHMH